MSISCERGRARGLVRHPTCTHARPKATDEEFDKRKEQLRRLLCLTQKDIDKLVVGNSKVLKIDIDGKVAPKSEMLQQRKLSIDQKRAGQILGSQRLIGAKKETLEERIDYLQNEFGLSKKQLAKVLVAFPELLTRSIKDHYEPLSNALQTSFGFTQEEIAKILTKNTYSFHRTSGKKNRIICLFPTASFWTGRERQRGAEKVFTEIPVVTVQH